MGVLEGETGIWLRFSKLRLKKREKSYVNWLKNEDILTEEHNTKRKVYGMYYNRKRNHNDCFWAYGKNRPNMIVMFVVKRGKYKRLRSGSSTGPTKNRNYVLEQVMVTNYVLF